MKKFYLTLIVTCIAVGLLWSFPFLNHFWSEIIDGRMEISLSQTTVHSLSDIFTRIHQDKTLSPYFFLLFLSFVNVKGKIMIYYALISLVAAWWSFLYFSKFTKKLFIASLLTVWYTCSLPLAIFFSSKYGIFSHLYAIIPLLGYLLYKILTDKKHFSLNVTLLFLLSILVSPYNLTVYIIILILTFWTLIILLVHTKEKIILSRKFFIFLCITLIVPLIQIAYQIQSLAHLSPGEMAIVQSESYQMTNTQSSYLNTFLLKWIWDFGVMWSKDAKAYDFQNFYGMNSVNALYFLSLSFLFIVSLYFYFRGEKVILRIVWGSLLFIVPLIVWAREWLFSEAYIAIYEHFRPFQIFRQGYKWMPWLVLFLTTAFAYISGKIRNITLNRLFTGAVIIFVFYNIFPFLTATQVKEGTMFQVPQDYYHLRDVIAKDSRILLLPEQYHASYTWGSPGWPIELIFSTNIIHAQPQMKSSVENVQYFHIIDILLSGKMENVWWNDKYDYILVRKDFDFRFNPDLIHDPRIFENILDKNKFPKIFEGDNLVLYSVKKPTL